MKRFWVIGLVLVLVFSLMLGSVPISFSQKKYNEAPMLAELVKQGKLPPVEERLPKNPLVVGPGVLIQKKDLPDWKVGKYGGTLRSVHHSPGWNPDFYIGNIEPLVAVVGEGVPATGVKGIAPNIIDKWEVSKDNKVFTFHIREGLKWSDGYPVTTEDVQFAYEDILLNDKLTPVFPVKLRSGYKSNGAPMKLEVLDKYTFRVIFAEPYGGFLLQLAINQWGDYSDFLLKPKHYLKQFHIKYTPLEKMQPLLKEMGLTNEWWHLFNMKNIYSWGRCAPQAVGFPMLTAWIPTSITQSTIMMERNPYYFKVDTAGNQLPYIDRIVSTQVQDVEMMNMKVITGEVDFLRENTALAKMPLYKANEEKGGFKVILVDHHLDPVGLELNFTYKDPAWRKVVGDVRFRKALNMAIDRKVIIDSVYYGFGGFPETASPYNPEMANRLLDEIGLNKRDKDGFRLGPDGKTFIIPVEYGTFVPEFPLVGDLLVEQLKKVGIKMTLKPIEIGLWGQRVNANELQATIMWLRDLGNESPWTWNPSEIISLYWLWYESGGKQGEEPPAWVKKGFEINEKIWASIPGSEEYNKAKREKLAWEKQYLPVISIVGKAKQPVIVSARLGNIPRSGRDIAINYSMEQFFFTR
jgi:peptide/nickel transport system substrate-binding protein